ncbi:MAG: sensor histidine kinase [Bacteroidia bacterium]|jgi:two-component system NarL family sensor kinase|nr:sensor histidine kinase [Bacteroidia bacterium]
MKRKKALFLFLFICYAFINSNAQVDSLENELNNCKIDTIKLQLLTDLNWLYLSTDLEKAKKFAETELALAKQINSQKFIAQAYNDLGIVCIKKSQFKDALEWHQKALRIRLTLSSKLDIASSYSKIGYCLSELDYYGLALKNQLVALKIYRELNDKVKIAYTINNLCYLYTALSQWDKEIELAKQAYAIGKELNDPTITAVALNNIGSSFEKKQNFLQAIQYKKIALQEFIKLNDSSSMASMMNNLGYYYRQLNKNTEAAYYYNKGKLIAKQVNDLNSLAMFYSNLGSLYIDLKNFDLAQENLSLAEELCKKQAILSTLIPVYKSFGNLHAFKGNGVLAVKYYDQYASLKDSLFNSDLTKQFSEMQTRFETNEKEAQNQVLLVENNLTKSELQRSNATKWALGISLLLIVLVFFIFYQNHNFKQKQLLQSERLQQQQQNAQAILAAEEKERQRIARDLHDGLGQRLSATKLNVSGLQSLIQSNQPQQETLFKNALTLLDQSVKDVRGISHNLLSHGLLKAGLPSALKEFVEQIKTPDGFKINLEIIGLENRLESSIENVLYRVLQEIVNNIMKHANASLINIQLIKHQNELSLMVEDNGIGFNLDEILTSGKGIGLKNIESRISLINGKVFFDSFPSNGTTVIIEIPL